MTQLPQYNHVPGTIIRIDGAAHRRGLSPMPGRLLLTNCLTGQPFLVPDGVGGTLFPSDDDYDRMVIEDRIEVEMPENVIASRALAAKAEWDLDDCEELDPGVRKTYAQCVLLDEAGVKNGLKAIEKGLARLWTEELRERFGEHDNPVTIKRWRSERGTPGARIPRLLVRLNGKVPRQPYLDEVPEEIKQKHALLRKGTRGPMKAQYALAATELRDVNRGLHPDYPQPRKPHPIFSYDTFRRACIALEGSEATGQRDGKQMVEATMRGAGRPLKAGRILEKVIIDHTPLDAFLVVDVERDIVAGRPWLTVAFDVHSRVALAWIITFRPPSYWTVCEILRRMNLPKRPPPCMAERYPVLKRICGKPGEIILDNAAEFTGHGLEDAAKGGSFSVRFCPIKMPRYRAIGERAFGTIPKKMLEHLPGDSGTIEYNRRTGHDGQDLACVTPNEMEAIANMAFAEYHTEPHDGIMDRQPALVFQKSANQHGIDVMHDVRRFRLETLEVRQNVRITKSGAVMFGGLRYHDPVAVPRLIDNLLRFEPRRQPRVDATVRTKIKFDPEDISRIHAWDRTTRSYVELRCDDETYADGMPLWFHEELRARARAEATRPPDDDAKPRPKRKGLDVEPSRLSDPDEDEQGVVGFNTEAERLAARAKRIEAIRAIAPGARHRERLTVARLYEIPRLRQITGNIVHLDTVFPQAVTTDDFIAHDVAAATALDAEIIAPRAPEKPKRARTGRGDRRDAGGQIAADHVIQEEAAPPRRRGSRLG